MDSRIPKSIIQVWGGGKHNISLLSKAAIANVRLFNPDFDYLFFDDKRIDDFINRHFSEYRSLFHSFRFPIQRYDLFRYLAIYHFGGFYLDLDVFLVKSLSDLLKFCCVFPFEELTINAFLRKEYGMDWEIGNYAFGAAAGHPFLHAVIKNCIRAQKDSEWVQPMLRSIPRMFREDYFVFYTTGPGLVSRTLAEYPKTDERVEVLFPEDVCDSTQWNRFGAFGIHLMQGTWVKQKGMLRRKLSILWRSWTRGRLLKESLKLGKNRSLEFKKISSGINEESPQK